MIKADFVPLPQARNVKEERLHPGSPANNHLRLRQDPDALWKGGIVHVTDQQG